MSLLKDGDVEEECPLFVELLPGEIETENLPWQSRKADPVIEEAVTPADPLGDESFEESIRVHGVLQTPKVARLAGTLGYTGDKKWGAVAGFRRIRASKKVAPERPIPCLVKRPAKDLSTEDKERRGQNLVENLQRRDIRTWEVAEWCHDFKVSHPEATLEEVAKYAALSVAYVSQLIRIRVGACPEVWEHYKRYGAGRISYSVLIQIVQLPREEQLAAWNEHVKAAGKRAFRRGKERRPGHARFKKWLGEVENTNLLSGYSKEYQRAVRYMLRVNLGLEKWPPSNRQPA